MNLVNFYNNGVASGGTVKAISMIIDSNILIKNSNISNN